MDTILRIGAAGILGGASCCLAMVAVYGYSKMRGREIDFRDPGAFKTGHFYIFFAVALFFTMVVYPGINGLGRVLSRLVG